MNEKNTEAASAEITSPVRKRRGRPVDIPAVDAEGRRLSPRTGKPVDTKKAHPVKRRRDSSARQVGVVGQNGVEAGDNSAMVNLNMELIRMPDVDMNDPEAVEQRIAEYLAIYAKYDMKPTVAGLGLALNGHSRQWLWAVANDQTTGSDGYMPALPLSVATVIKKTYKMLENLWETYMLGGKINPVTGIFLAKNQYGYRDQTDVVVAPKNKQTEDFSADEIRERYLPKKDQ